MDLEKAIHVTPSIQGAGSDTVYFCVVDRKGNACSMINR
jgi:gamma-glutamyltranspeptidase